VFRGIGLDVIDPGTDGLEGQRLPRRDPYDRDPDDDESPQPSSRRRRDRDPGGLGSRLCHGRTGYGQDGAGGRMPLAMELKGNRCLKF
jgi:hypothetical protein